MVTYAFFLGYTVAYGLENSNLDCDFVCTQFVNIMNVVQGFYVLDDLIGST